MTAQGISNRKPRRQQKMQKDLNYFCNKSQKLVRGLKPAAEKNHPSPKKSRNREMV
jgi:hypothetical protein